MVSGTILLIGKIVFLLALYGFLYTVFRGLARQAVELPAGSPSTRRRGAVPVIREPVVLRPAPAPAQAATLPTSSPEPAEEEPEPLQEEPLPAFLTRTAHPGTQPLAPAVEEAAAEPTATEAEATQPPVVPEPAPASGSAPEPEPEPVPQGPVLVILRAPEAGLESGAQIPIAGHIAVGRAEGNAVVLQDRFVSSHHAELEEVGGRVVLRDLDSTNGTFLNGTRVTEPVTLSDGDRVIIGTSAFAFREHLDE